MNMSTMEQAREARDIAASQLDEIPGVQVVGVGLTKRDGGYAVKVNLEHAAPAGAIRPDMTVCGVPVVVEVVGEIVSG
ncbi:hypothetical protein [Massilia yuzhufengensis]|uniref:Uncharacterized protein n=1 Tax=Massilia yuzhufengensis TaxID=1164594 RepID=A0A1I1N1K7_9BURK|nr:hypothetical protein [Massilia yuzhufengensis]SFC91574.1 hypothetical protein SAMN05216204_11250 [Massilia yuzhufengensis]